MKRWWILLAWAPLASATDLWLVSHDQLSRALAERYDSVLEQVLEQPLDPRLVDSTYALRRQVSSAGGLGWGEVGNPEAALYSVPAALVSRQDVPLTIPDGRIGHIKGALWVDRFQAQYPDTYWIAFELPSDALLALAAGEIDGVVDSVPSLSFQLATLGITGVRIQPMAAEVSYGLLASPNNAGAAKIGAALAAIQPTVQSELARQFTPLPEPAPTQPAWLVSAALGVAWLITLIAWGLTRSRDRQPKSVAVDKATRPARSAQQDRSQAYLNEVNQRLQREIAKRHAKEAELMTVQDALNQAHARLEQQVRTDALTKLANRRHFDEQLTKEWRRHCRERAPMSIVLMDIDFFKKYNDTLGHPAGDECLRRVAAVLSDSFGRSGDLVARYGGEEFVVLLPQCDAIEAAEQVERMQARMAQVNISHPASDISNQVTLSMGIASCAPMIDDDPWSLVEEADQALYQAKIDGRNRYRVVAA